MYKNLIASDTITDDHSDTTSPVIAEIMTANSTNASEDYFLPLILLRKKIYHQSSNRIQLPSHIGKVTFRKQVPLMEHELLI